MQKAINRSLGRRLLYTKTFASTFAMHPMVRMGVVATLFGSLIGAVAGCDTHAVSRAAEPPPSSDGPTPIRQTDEIELTRLNKAELSQSTLVTVRETALPGILDSVGQVTFDDRLLSSIISRLTARLEDIRVSPWNTATRGQPMFLLYSPDFKRSISNPFQLPGKNRGAERRSTPLA